MKKTILRIMLNAPGRDPVLFFQQLTHHVPDTKMLFQSFYDANTDSPAADLIFLDAPKPAIRLSAGYSFTVSIEEAK